MSKKLEQLKQQTAELEKQASIKQTLLENDRRFGEPTARAIRDLTSQIAENEQKIKDFLKIFMIGGKI